MLNRRKFLRVMSMFGAVILTPLGKWMERYTIRNLKEPSLEGELYAGFLLLQEGTGVPDFVFYPQKGIPNVCGTGDGPKAITEQSYAEDFLSSKHPDIKWRKPEYLPEGYRFSTCYSMKYANGDFFGGAINYTASSGDVEIPSENISIWAQVDYPVPYPIWYSQSIDPNEPSIVLEKVEFLPSAGLMTASKRGFIFYWMEDDTFYTLYVEGDQTRDEAIKLASSLIINQ